MTQNEKRLFLIKYLLNENSKYSDIIIPEDIEEQKRLLRSLLNVRMPKKVSSEFLEIQDSYLQEEINGKGITDIGELEPIKKGIYVWQGDITTLKCDAIVNAANNQMLGCFYPCHSCIDNAIHTFAGIQMRLECAKIMKLQNSEEKTGKAKITSAFNLPCKYVLHSVGPIVRGRLCKEDEEKLASCYRSCLELAEQSGVKSIAFCCISTGVFMFPNKRAAELAVQTVKQYKEKTKSKIKVIFNVFKEEDERLYKQLLG